MKSVICSATDTGELAEMAPVGRELVLLPRDQQWYSKAAVGPDGSRVPPRTTTMWIENLPTNFSGRMTMHTPEYLVEVSVRIDVTETETEASSEDEFSDKAMVPLDSGIRLQARDDDYVCVTCCQRQLPELTTMSASCLRRIVRIVDWDEVREAIPHSHCIIDVIALQANLWRLQLIQSLGNWGTLDP